MKGAQREIALPSHVRLQDEDWPFWHSVIAEFARSEWTDHSLELAALLARAMADLEREQLLVREEGSVLVRPSGVMVVNPRNRTVATLLAEILSLRRSLALHARARGGDTRNIGRRNALAKQIEQGSPFNDPLLA